MQIRRFWFPLAMSVCVIALSGRSASITDSAGGRAPEGVTLELPFVYMATSPLSRTLDAMTLLSSPQTIAVVISLVVLLLAWRFLQKRRVLRPLFALLVCVALIEAAVAFAPRPMARLRVADPQVVTVDFHSHTGASHDVRKSVSPGDNREWHRSGGFDIAYVTDHVKFSGAVEGRKENPDLAGDGTSLLTGVEGRYHKIMSTIMLGLDERDTALLNKRGNFLPGTAAAGEGPVTIVALPNRHLDSVTVASLDSIPHFAAIELIDAAPRGLGQFDRQEPKIRKVARDLRLILVAGSNNHGYGRTVAAWNLLAIPGWRALPPNSVGKLIERRFRNRELGAVTIVQRSRPRTHDASLPLTLPVLAGQVIGALTPFERLTWILWIWAVTLLIYVTFRPHRLAVRRAAGEDGNKSRERRAYATSLVSQACSLLSDAAQDHSPFPRRPSRRLSVHP